MHLAGLCNLTRKYLNDAGVAGDDGDDAQHQGGAS